MDLRHKRRELQGLVGAIGVAVALAGFVGGFYSPTTTIFATFVVWAVGATLVNDLTDKR